ncbi:MAG: hypothetical protein ABSB32_18990 [Thermodesulfobacteriota bacterium]
MDAKEIIKLILDWPFVALVAIILAFIVGLRQQSFFLKKRGLLSFLITLTALVFVSILLALAHKEGQVTNFLSFGKVLVPWATVIGVVGAFIAAFSALKTYRSNNSIRKWELIEKIYGAFLENHWYDFYERIQGGEQIDLRNKEEEKLLNEMLTKFDALDYFQTQGLLDDKAWEYVACEIQDFALNNSVWEYIGKIEKPYLVKGFPKDIIPFTGLPELYDELPDKFKAKCPPQLEERFDALSPEEKESYYSKVQYIPNNQLKRAAAIGFFAKAKGITILQEKDNRDE